MPHTYFKVVRYYVNEDKMARPKEIKEARSSVVLPMSKLNNWSTRLY